MPRARTVVERPEGLEYHEDVFADAEERELLAFLQTVELRQFTMRGQTARRTVRHYGFDYDYEQHGRLTATEPLPAELEFVRERAARVAGLPADDLVQALVTRYPPDAGIGWHRDAPMFGSKVIGASLASSCRMRFQRRAGEVRKTYELELAPRSVYVLGGAARWSWQHAIPPGKELRYSITFRSLRARRAEAAG